MNIRLIISFIAIFILPISVLAGQVVLTKQVDKPSAKPGDILTYFIAYQNQGTQTLTKVSIMDVIPQNTVFHEASGTDTTIYYGDDNGNLGTSSTLAVSKVKWVINSSVGAGDMGTVSLRVRVK